MNAIVQVQRFAVAMELLTLSEVGAVHRLRAAIPKQGSLSDPSSQSLRQVYCPTDVAHNDSSRFRRGTKEVNPWTLQPFDFIVRQIVRSEHTTGRLIPRVQLPPHLPIVPS